MGDNLPTLGVDDSERFEARVAVDLRQLREVVNGAYVVSAEVDPSGSDEFGGDAESDGAEAGACSSGRSSIPAHRSVTRGYSIEVTEGSLRELMGFLRIIARTDGIVWQIA